MLNKEILKSVICGAGLTAVMMFATLRFFEGLDDVTKLEFVKMLTGSVG